MMCGLPGRTWLQHLLLTVLALVALAQPVRASVSIGEVTLSIGASQIEREGKREPVTKGYGIIPGDVIHTAASGHVHIRFIDGALVSVRPDSMLRVVEYRYDAADPSASLIKFHLETGTVRGISGKAAQAAHEKFRLNTPLVAIGVKGTDFVTQASAARAVVLVNQGAIVLAPLDSVCRADGFGPCTTSRARELAESMNGMALVYRQAAVEPVLQPVNTLKGADHIAPVLLQERVSQADTATAVADSRSPGPALLDALTPRTKSLTWGRWITKATAPGDNLTVPFVEALRAGRVTVGDGYYFLFRNENIPNFLSSASGVANFRLQGGAASYREPSNLLSAASIDGGSLSIDFGRHTFSTQLSVTAQSVGTHAVAATGTIDRTTGIFLSNGAAARVAGAVSLDTSEAGYFFSKPVGNGALVGATVWQR